MNVLALVEDPWLAGSIRTMISPLVRDEVNVVTLPGPAQMQNYLRKNSAQLMIMDFGLGLVPLVIFRERAGDVPVILLGRNETMHVQTSRSGVLYKATRASLRDVLVLAMSRRGLLDGRDVLEDVIREL